MSLVGSNVLVLVVVVWMNKGPGAFEQHNVVEGGWIVRTLETAGRVCRQPAAGGLAVQALHGARKSAMKLQRVC